MFSTFVSPEVVYQVRFQYLLETTISGPQERIAGGGTSRWSPNQGFERTAQGIAWKKAANPPLKPKHVRCPAGLPVTDCES
jgi:hypothetical protein